MKTKVERVVSLEGVSPSTEVPPWGEFQLVLAINRAGSIAKACGPLGLTHSTLLRQLDAVEARLRTRLFERGRSRYALTPAGHEIALAAAAFEPIARAAATRALGQDLQPSGELRVSVASIVLDQLLAPLLVQFAAAFPEVTIELAAGRDPVNLRRREADVAIRIADTVPDWLVGRRLPEVQFRIYGRRRSGRGLPLKSIPTLTSEQRWIAFERDARDLKFDRWLAARVPDEHVVLRVDDFNHALAMVRAGLGIALLPTFVEAGAPELLPLSATIAELQTPLWLVTHPELKNTARVQVMLRAFGPALAHLLRSTAEPVNAVAGTAAAATGAAPGR